MMYDVRFQYYKKLRFVQTLLFLACCAVLNFAQSLSPLKTISGNVDYFAIGATMNAKDQCNYSNSSSAYLTLPDAAIIKSVYLYWSGSSQPAKYGPYVDDDVFLNNVKIKADKSWTESRRLERKILHYYGSFADVTHLIKKSERITIRDLWWNNTFGCPFNASYGGWSLVVVFEHPANPFRILNMYEGLEFIGLKQQTIYRLENVEIPSCEGDSRISLLSWDADDQIEDKLFIDNHLVRENVFGSPNSDFSFNKITVPKGSYSSNSVIRVDFEPADDFIAQLFILDYGLCEDGCSFDAPNDTVLYENQGLDLTNLGRPTSDCDLVYEYKDIVWSTCPKLIERTWIGTPSGTSPDNCCSSQVYRKQRITIVDSIPPSIENCISLDAEIICGGDINFRIEEWNAENIRSIKSCVTESSGTITVSSNLNLNNLRLICGNSGELEVTYFIEDECDNRINLVGKLSVFDNIPPEINCRDIEYQIIDNDSIEITAQMVDNGSSDNCGSLENLEVKLPGFNSTDCGNSVFGHLIGTDACGMIDSCIFEVTPMCFDLALIKFIETDQVFQLGDTINFGIAVINQGNLPATQVTIADYLPNGFTLISNDWSQVNDYVIYEHNSMLAGGETLTINLAARIDSISGAEEVLNIAEIIHAETEEPFLPIDIDSKFDDIPSNDIVVDNAINNEDDDEDDHDIFVIPVIVNCDLEILEPVVTLPTCSGGADGSINISTAGGYEPFEFQWSDGSQLEDLTNIPAGLYRLLITDNLGCTAEIEVDVQDPAGFQCEIQIESDYFGFGVSATGASDGILSVQIDNLSQPYGISWSNGSSDSLIQNIPAGEYSVSVTDINGCECTSTIELTEPLPLECSILEVKGISCPGALDAILDLEVSGGIEAYDILWNTGDSVSQISNLNVGDYTVTVTDRLGETCVTSYEILPAVPIEASASSEPENCMVRDGSIAIDISGGTPPYQYNWSNGDTAKDLRNIKNGVYSLTITDQNGCEFILEEKVEQTTCAGVGDFVWKDENRNGVQDESEPGVNGIMVILRNAETLEILDTVLTSRNPETNSDGFYFFKNIPTGIYQVIFIKDETFDFTIANAGDPIIDSDANPLSGVSFTFLVEPGEFLESIDAGLIMYSYIGDFVWFDADDDDIQDEGERGIPHVKLYLQNGEGDIVDSTLSDVEGRYIFNQLDSGSYRVFPVIPDEVNGEQVKLSNKSQGDNPLIDSDINPETGWSDFIEIQSCTQVTDIDIGFQVLVPQNQFSGNDFGSALVYPNPASHQVKLTIDLQQYEESVEIKVINERGQILQNRIVKNSRGDRLESIFNIDKYTSGKYYFYISILDRIQIIPFEIIR